MQPLLISTSFSSVRDKVDSVVLHHLGVNVDLTHAIDNDRDLHSLSIVQNVIEQGRFSLPPKNQTKQ